MRLTFPAEPGEVTGSCYRVEAPQVRFLMDCRLFQGEEKRNARTVKPLLSIPNA